MEQSSIYKIYIEKEIPMMGNLLEFFRKSDGAMGRIGRKGDGERGRKTK